ncbi:hypothetical protein P9112_000690 [Eukaryota sp. TZLM1-RC]
MDLYETLLISKPNNQPALFIKFRTLLIRAALFVGFMVLWIWLFSGNPWKSWKQADCVDFFCEYSVGAGNVQQPSNAFSGLIFIWVALWLLFHVEICDAEFAQAQGAIWLLLAFVLILRTAGSFFYHATETLSGERLDSVSAVLLVAFLSTFSFVRLYIVLFGQDKFELRHYIFLMIVIPQFIFIFILHIFLNHSCGTSWFLIGIYIFAIFAFEFILAFKQWQWPSFKLKFAGGVFLLALVFWIIDNKYWYCNPLGLFQGHALFHILSAVALRLLIGVFLKWDSDC